VTSFELTEESRTALEGYIKGIVTFIDASKLYFREYVSIKNCNITLYTYSFHYSKDSQLVFRYDNTPHYPRLSSFPHHKHCQDSSVIDCKEPTLKVILDEIEDTILQSKLC